MHSKNFITIQNILKLFKKGLKKSQGIYLQDDQCKIHRVYL